MENMVCYEFRKGEYLFQADDVSQELHIIWSGSFAQKLRSGQQIGVAGRGMGPAGGVAVAIGLTHADGQSQAA